MRTTDEPNELDDAIRAAVREVVSSAPLPPDLSADPLDDGVPVHRLAPPLDGYRDRRRATLVAVAAAACLLAAVPLIVDRGDDPGRVGTDPGATAAPTPQTAPAPWPSGEPTMVRPTLVEPTRLPSGYVRDAAGRVESGSNVGGAQLGRLVVWPTTGAGVIEVMWRPGDCGGRNVPGTSMGDGYLAPTREQALGVLVSRAEPERVSWCEGGLVIQADSSDVAGEQVAGILRTLRPSGDPAAPVAVDEPAGWRTAYPPGATTAAGVNYRRGPGPANVITIRLEGAGPDGIGVPVPYSMNGPRSIPVRQMAGRAAIVSRDGGNNMLRVTYDDHTIVTVFFNDQTDAELEDLIASLAPVSADRFPDVAGDVAACDRVGLCG